MSDNADVDGSFLIKLGRLLFGRAAARNVHWRNSWIEISPVPHPDPGICVRVLRTAFAAALNEAVSQQIRANAGDLIAASYGPVDL